MFLFYFILRNWLTMIGKMFVWEYFLIHLVLKSPLLHLALCDSIIYGINHNTYFPGMY
jgi:hypothetical protein